MSPDQSNMLMKHVSNLRANLGCSPSILEELIDDLENAIDAVDCGLLPNPPKED